MATAAEHFRRYRARRHDDEIVPWSRCRRDTPGVKQTLIGRRRKATAVNQRKSRPLHRDEREAGYNGGVDCCSCIAALRTLSGIIITLTRDYSQELRSSDNRSVLLRNE